VGESAAPSEAQTLPSGMVTLLFTDLEGSTRLLEAHPAAYRAAVRRHHGLLRGAVEAHGGVVFETVGDAVYAAFARPTDAVAAALAGQLALRAADWGDLGPGAIRARMGLHTGEVEVQGAHYFGAPLYRCARLTATAHGGQTVLSAATAELVQDELPGGRLRDLGGHRLKDLARPERVFQLLHPDLPQAFPPLRSVGARRHNLPAQPTAFVGREREVAAVIRRLLRRVQQPAAHGPGDAPRLLTLTGPGGVGKTRLALQVAAEVAEDAFPDGEVFVGLGGLAPGADVEVVVSAVAQALGVRETVGRSLREAVADDLREKRLLLLMDNCEHVPAAAPWVGELLAACPGLAVLATSRAPLRLAAEHEWPVPPLALPAAPGRGAGPPAPPDLKRLRGADAVALFVQRAQAAAPDFALTAATAPAVAELCRRLDGLPLAIELAAARTKLLLPPHLLERLGNRLTLLTGGARDRPPRQQTLRAALDWSYQLLDPGEQTLFARLAVFVGGCTLEAAEAVCPAAGATTGERPPDVLDGLAALADQSLLRQEDRADGHARFVMLETIHEFARERLAESGELDAVQRRHANHFLALAEQARADLQGPQAAVRLEQLEREHDNLRAALQWAIHYGEADHGLRLAMALTTFWDARGYWREGRRWLESLLAQPGVSSPSRLRATGLRAAGFLAWHQGDAAAAQRLFAVALAINRALGDLQTAASSLVELARVAETQGKFLRADRLLRAALPILRAGNDRRRLALPLLVLGRVALARGDHAAARAFEAESLAIHRESGNRRGVALALTGLGEEARSRGDAERATAYYEEALTIVREMGDMLLLVSNLHNLGQVALRRGDPERAAALFREGLALARHAGTSGVYWAESVAGMAAVAAQHGQPERAARLLGAVRAAQDASGVQMAPVDQAAFDGCVATARSRLNDGAFSAAWAEGNAMSLEQAVADALEEAQADA
jgi:predicted ATPase/class 3 adenylate cyclase